VSTLDGGPEGGQLDLLQGTRVDQLVDAVAVDLLVAGGSRDRGSRRLSGWVDVTLADPSLQWSAASIISTADDLDRLTVALFSSHLVPAPQPEAMFTVPDVLRARPV
jgi:hypothetical protein